MSKSATSLNKNGTMLLKEKVDEVVPKLSFDLKTIEKSLLINGNWQVKCELEYGSENLPKKLYKGQGEAKASQDAKHEACLQILNQINKDESNPKKTKESPTPSSKIANITQPNWNYHFLDNQETLDLAKNEKSIQMLEEFCRNNLFNLPSYATSKIGPDHKPIFEVSCKVEETIATGIAKTLKDGERVAAHKVLKILRLNLAAKNKTARGLTEPIINSSKPSAETSLYHSATNNAFSSKPNLQIPARSPNPLTSYSSLEKQAEPQNSSSALKPEVSLDSRKEIVAEPTKKKMILIEGEDEGQLIQSHVNYWPNIELGFGGNAKVFAGYYEVRAKKAAVKKPFKYSDQIEREISILQELSHHPNVVQYFGTEKLNSDLFIAMERANSTLEKILPESKIEDIKSFLKNALEGVEFLHNQKKGIVHRDLKPSNILIFHNNDQKVAKIADFGISRKVESITLGTYTNTFGTMEWMSPECLNAAFESRAFKVSYSCDIFALGLIIFYGLTNGNSHPFGHLKLTERTVIKAPQWEVFEQFPCRLSLQNFLSPVFSNSYSSRPKIEILLEHPFFWSGKKFLDFVGKVANEIKTNRDIVRELDDNYESFCFSSLKMHVNWKVRLCQKVQNVLKSSVHPKKYDGTSLLDLIEFIRDKEQHSNELRKRQLDATDILGDTEESYGDYFMTKFPELSTFLYTNMQKHYSGLSRVKPFYVHNKDGIFEIMK